jgi:hypothetical protein
VVGEMTNGLYCRIVPIVSFESREHYAVKIEKTKHIVGEKFKLDRDGAVSLGELLEQMYQLGLQEGLGFNG